MKTLTTQQVKDKLNYVIRVFGSDLGSAAITGAVNWDGYNSAVDKCSAVKKSYAAMAERIAELEAALDAAIKDRDWHSEQLDRRSERGAC